MNQNTAVQRFEAGAIIAQGEFFDFDAQLTAIEELMKTKMKRDVHFGSPPGCDSDKPMLYKDGANLIKRRFMLYTQLVDRIIDDLPNGHKNFTIHKRIIHVPTNLVVGEGIGSCSTMETKYRYRNEVVGEVPQEYWKSKDSSLLGGPDFSPKKMKGVWKIVHRIEVKDIADVWNTCLKMADKRADSAAVFTSTAAREMFNDIADDDEDEEATGNQQNGRTSNGAQQQTQGQQNAQIKNPDAPATDKQLKCLYALVNQYNISDEVMKGLLRDELKVNNSKELTMAQASALIEKIKNGGLSKREPGDDDDIGQAGY